MRNVVALLLLAACARAFISRGLSASSYKRARCGPNNLSTRWSALVNASSPPLPEFPRPQMVRAPLPDGSPGPSLACAVIVKRVDAQTRAKTAITELLRD